MAKMTGGGRLGTVSVIFLDDTEDALSWSTIHFLRTSWCMNGKGGDNLSPPFREFRVALLHLLRHTPVPDVPLNTCQLRFCRFYGRFADFVEKQCNIAGEWLLLPSLLVGVYGIAVNAYRSYLHAVIPIIRHSHSHSRSKIVSFPTII